MAEVGYESLKIIQWNCKSVNAPGRTQELKVLIYKEKPHIACISETWLNQSKSISAIGYKVIRKDRADGAGGGLLFLIREDLNFNLLQITTIPNSNIEAHAIELSLARDTVSLLHVYNPVTNITINHLDHLIQQLERKFIMVGDFNGHHTIWDPELPDEKINQCGRELSKYIIDHPNLALITTPGLKTYTHTTYRGSNSSTLDLSLCSNNLIQLCETTLLGDSGSDHTPVLTTVRLRPDKKIRKRRRKWKLNETSWDTWKTKVDPQTTLPENINEEATNLSSKLTKAAESTFGKTKGLVKAKFSKPWWTAECAKAVARRRRAKKLMERQPTQSNIIDFRRLSAKAKLTIRRAKRSSWRKFCENLTAETPKKVVWNLIRRLNGKGAPSDIPLEKYGKLISEDSEKANILAENLWDTIGRETGNISQEQSQTIQEAKDSPAEDSYNSRFTMKELRECIKDLPSDKATGDDEVHNKFLKNLPDHTMRELLGLINRSWRNAEVPSSWRHSLIVPILKEGKPSSDPNSYRPVSLISGVSKVMEKMIARRLGWTTEKNNTLRDTQCGFRKGKSTEDLILKLEHTVRASLINRKVTIAVFFDLKQAFDNVDINLLLYKMASLGIKGRTLCWIEQFLKERTYQIIVGDAKSETLQTKRGLPQGSILSPLLFNIMMSDLPRLDNIVILDYADDIAFLSTESTIEEASENIFAAISKLEEWAKDWALDINPQKTKAMCFTKQKVLNRKPTFKIDDTDIDWVQEFKYLGVTCDAPTLTWTRHTDIICNEGLQRQNILRALAGSTWGADRDLMLSFYTSYIRPKLLYGIAAVASASTTNMDRLERIQNSAIRLAIGARNTSPIAALQAEADLPPLQELIAETTCRTFFRMASHDHPLLTEMKADTAIQDKIWTPVFKKPFVKRCEETLRAWNIPMEADVRQVLLPSAPPWEAPPLQLSCSLESTLQKDFSMEQTKAVALSTISSWYNPHFKIYTDGSKTAVSTTAALWIPELQVEESWKLDHGNFRSIMGAELYAINRALHWLILNLPLLENPDVVVLTDSKSGIMALQNHHHRSYSHTANQILNLAKILKDSGTNLTIQWIPSHTGISGNDKADELARVAHNHLEITQIPLDPKEMKICLRSTRQRRCQQKYDATRQGLHIGSIKEKIETWPWANHKNRKVATALTRLRIGHSRLKAHLHKFHLNDDPNCSTCATPEDTVHILEECSKSRAQRVSMHQTLLKLGITAPNTKTLLGGSTYDESTQWKIVQALENFLTSSGSLDLI